ncbi:hypothetical protein P152DRAFT_26970 [Eremomyces bilateralis CBS 781.70]|uniref:Uncharacterized protein n=1 Tax=Eremomyces bilateralis CBS 781.70 TaxID=1392243 RepID=A0A6G1G2J9_9PEZI|nr:uncharacterized protein P152DRAFT_26970 [Eremomyces bilateralis CBS 781.70]KAF1812151.1 hypothetical protein P152DRAFT_26970 [Eremomyces bilateralis CBS 781.70]
MTFSASQNGTVIAKSPHVSDPSLQPFLQPSFDPVDFLNGALPHLAVGSQASSQRSSQSIKHVSLQEASSTAQTQLSQLAAQTTRLCNVLTQLTDDILRCGGRLAYEVEVLRGEAIGLSELLNDGLQDEFKRLLPSGLADLSIKEAEDAPLPSQEPAAEKSSCGPNVPITDQPPSPPVQKENGTSTTKSDLLAIPPVSDQTDAVQLSLKQLRTLTFVRARLDAVIRTFGEATKWSVPPSELSLASSFISVSAPTAPGSSTSVDGRSAEDRAQEFAERLRGEVAECIVGPVAEQNGYQEAMRRIAALRELAGVWKGTAEEKARGRFVEGLVRLAEEKQKVREREGAYRRRSGSVRQSERPEGYLEHLARLKEEASFT